MSNAWRALARYGLACSNIVESSQSKSLQHSIDAFYALSIWNHRHPILTLPIIFHAIAFRIGRGRRRLGLEKPQLRILARSLCLLLSLASLANASGRIEQVYLTPEKLLATWQTYQKYADPIISKSLAVYTIMMSLTVSKNWNKFR